MRTAMKRKKNTTDMLRTERKRNHIKHPIKTTKGKKHVKDKNRNKDQEQQQKSNGFRRY